MKSKISAIIGILILTLLISVPNVLAIGITPGKATLEFQPSMQKTGEITVINNEHKEMGVLIGLEGDLMDYVSLDTKSLIFQPNEESKIVRYTLNLPSTMNPGMHTLKVDAAEIPSGGKGTYMGEGVFVVGATVVVTSQLVVKVPYPYKYAEIRLDVRESPVNGTTNFYVEVENLGQHDLVDMQAIVEILGPTNEKITILKTNKMTIPAGKRGELAAAWEADVNPGQYKAVASLSFDEGKMANAEKIFNVGSLELDVIDVSVKNFKLGDIAKFDITVANKWSSVIRDVYAQVQIFDQSNQQIANVKTASMDVPGLGNQIFNAYWDTAGIKEGTYSGKLILNYANKVLERDLKTDIKLDRIDIEIVGIGVTAKATAATTGFKPNLMTILIILLILINIGWFVYFKLKSSRNEKTGKITKK